MSVEVEDIYAHQIRQLSRDEKLQLVAIITRDLVSNTDSDAGPNTPDDRFETDESFRTKFAGAIRLGYPPGADNETIDSDLATEYQSRSESD